MSESKLLLIGAGAILIGSALTWWNNRGIKKLTKGAPSGYYWLEGLLNSSNPIEYNGKHFAKLICITSKGIQILNEYDITTTFSSNCNSTIVQQLDSSQALTINDVDVTEFINDFPLITIHEEPGIKVQALPINLGKYRVTGYFNTGGKLSKVHNSTAHFELLSTTNHVSVSTYLILFGCILCTISVSKI
jgi:hypothetical protein